MKKIRCICQNCGEETGLFDSVCSSCGSFLEAVDFTQISDADLAITNIKTVGGYVSLDINGKTYEYLPGEPNSGKNKGKQMTAKEIVAYLIAYLQKSKSPGKVLQWVKANLITKKEAGIGKGKSDGYQSFAPRRLSDAAKPNKVDEIMGLLNAGKILELEMDYMDYPEFIYKKGSKYIFYEGEFAKEQDYDEKGFIKWLNNTVKLEGFEYSETDKGAMEKKIKESQE